MDFTWSNDEDLNNACARYNIYCKPKVFSYIPTRSLLQEGPQCGILALTMLLKNSTKDNVNVILKNAIELGFTNNGEMFSVDNMYKLSETLISNKLEIFNGNIACEKIQSFLFSGGQILVPYDADSNHEPCFKNGHKAHWALVCGAFEDERGVYVIARHGKSRHLGVWNLDLLARSNQQLFEFAPDRKHSDISYVLPEGGISGPCGLNNRSILVYNGDC